MLHKDKRQHVYYGEKEYYYRIDSLDDLRTMLMDDAYESFVDFFNIGEMELELGIKGKSTFLSYKPDPVSVSTLENIIRGASPITFWDGSCFIPRISYTYGTHPYNSQLFAFNITVTNYGEFISMFKASAEAFARYLNSAKANAFNAIVNAVLCFFKPESSDAIIIRNDSLMYQERCISGIYEREIISFKSLNLKPLSRNEMLYGMALALMPIVRARFTGYTVTAGFGAGPKMRYDYTDWDNPYGARSRGSSIKFEKVPLPEPVLGDW